MLKDSIETIDKLTVICFSPTRTSRKIAEAVAAGMTGMSGGTAGYADASRQIRTIDLTLDRSDEPIILNSGGAVVLGAPVYAGRVAPEAIRRLRRIQVAAGASVPAVVTVTYGNRDYEDALVELYDLAVSLGLSPFAAGAFIGEHSYSTPEIPVAEGRPDSMDIADARIFGGQCRQKLDGPGAFAPFSIKGTIQRAVPPGLRHIPYCTVIIRQPGQTSSVCPVDHRRLPPLRRMCKGMPDRSRQH